MLKFVVVCRAKVSDHRTVKPGDDNTTATSKLVLVDTVLGEDTLLHAGIVNLFAVGILANAADIDDGLWREGILYPRSD